MPFKTVEIHRQYSFAEEANQDPQVREYFDMTYRSIGPYPRIIGKIPESGLSPKEEEILLPHLVGYKPGEREYREEVNKFFNQINTHVPAEGRKLIVSLEDDKAPLSQDNLPVKIEDFIRYKHALKHPQVGKNREEAERYQHKKFYVLDQDEQTLTASKMLKVEDQAQEYYLQVRKDPQKVDMVLTLLNIDTRALSPDEMNLELKRQATSDPSQADVINEQKLDRFINICKDRDMQIKYDIYQLISHGILERVSRRILDRESGNVLGNNLKETVLFFKDKANAKQVNYYQAELEESRRKEGKKSIIPATISQDKQEETKKTTSKKKSAPATKSKPSNEEPEAAIAEFSEDTSLADFEVDDDEKGEES